jgi:hypothetical protein
MLMAAIKSSIQNGENVFLAAEEDTEGNFSELG